VIDQTACCVPRVTSALTPHDAERAARVFKAMGDPTRVLLLSLISGSPEGEACICDLT
jgi:ArsR family transcriptional regulator